MSLLVDTFWDEAQRRLVSAGWVIVDGSRYDPTVINGVTPTGKSFTFTYIGDTATLTVAGRKKSDLFPRLLFEPGDKTVDAIETAYALFPVNQR